jgi:SAM-dependent methyltransferase
VKLSEFHPNRFVAPRPVTRRMQARFVHYFPPAGTVLDIGCGEGVFLDLLNESGRVGIGVEHTTELAQQCRAHGHTVFGQDVFRFLRSRKNRFDGIFASHLIEHFPTSDGLRLLQSAYDALRENGVLVIITPTFRDILVSGERFWLDISHVRPYPLPLLHELLTHLGLEIVDEGYEPSTKAWKQFRRLRSYLYYVLAKLRFGRYYDVGDTFIVGKKKSGVR